jgi:hypothetical protein
MIRCCAQDDKLSAERGKMMRIPLTPCILLAGMTLHCWLVWPYTASWYDHIVVAGMALYCWLAWPYTGGWHGLIVVAGIAL